MNFEELLKALGGLENGPALTSALTSLNESFKSELSRKNKENQTLRERAKTAEADAKGMKERLEDIYDGMNWDEETDLAEALAVVKKGQGVAPDMQKRLERLQKNFNEEKGKLTEELTALRGEKTDRLKRDALRKELSNAHNPDAIIDLFLGKVEVGEDGAVSFSDGKALKDGVAAWFTDNAWAVKNSQVPGAGSNGNQTAGGGQGGDDNQNLSFGAQLAKSTHTGTPGAENPYFK